MPQKIHPELGEQRPNMTELPTQTCRVPCSPPCFRHDRDIFRDLVCPFVANNFVVVAWRSSRCKTTWMTLWPWGGTISIPIIQISWRRRLGWQRWRGLWAGGFGFFSNSKRKLSCRMESRRFLIVLPWTNMDLSQGCNSIDSTNDPCVHRVVSKRCARFV